MNWNKRHPLFTGTIILTGTGLASRVIGFLYRIFLSRHIGAAGLGIYQLVFPVLTLTLTLCAGGIQTAISKYSAEREDLAPFASGICVSALLSLICAGLVYHYAPWLAVHVIGETACEPLLRIMSYSLPFACMHACFNGYYYGKNKTAVPAISQLFEQVVRVLSVYLFWLIAQEQQLSLTPSHVMWGTVCGEVASFLFCVLTFRQGRFRPTPGMSGQLLRFAAPLTLSHLILNLFASAESILIPPALVSLGHSREDALSSFGTLTGMAMPVIMLPTVFTGSLSVLLLPAISSAAATGNKGQIRRQVRHTLELCIILGLCCTLAFLILGPFMGYAMFHSELAGTYIQALGWLCPFLFLTGTLSSILHGLDMTLYTFLLNLSGCGLRLLAIYLLVPRFGLFVYLWSMLVTQILQAGADLWILRRKIS